MDLLIYSKNVDGTIIHSDTEELMQEMVLEHMGIDMQAMTNASNSMFGEQATAMMGMGGSSMNLWQELLPGENGNPVNDLLKKQYDVVYGSWPNRYDEIMLVLDENNELDDMTLYALGLEPKEDVDNIMEAAVNGKELQKDNKNWSYADSCDMDFRTVLNADCYRYDENTGLYVLIAFVAISLIVSSIMIGVITLISVQERTKEIGILRAIGASKRDVSSMFNAENDYYWIYFWFVRGSCHLFAVYSHQFAGAPSHQHQQSACDSSNSGSHHSDCHQCSADIDRWIYSV